MAKVDCLFIHVPKLKNHYRPIDQFIWINFLPMGLLGLADLLQRHGISTEIVHMGVEWIEDHHFSIVNYVREKNPRMIAMDLHWHHQSFDVIEMAKRLKAAFSDLYLLLGGFTASFFHEEILRNFDAIDGIIRGEAEEPILQLARALLQGKEDLFSVPNLTWRRGKRVLVNPLSYVASEEDLNALSFTDFQLLKNYPTYIRYIGQPFYVKGLSKEKNFKFYSLKSPTYHLTVGRGCPVQCTWCSGNIPSQETVTGRKEVVFRGVEEVLQSIREAFSYGYESFHICFDPYPQRPEYFLDLFSHIRKERIQMECVFESFGLPAVDFIKSFKETFPGEKSRIALSPDAGSDRLRRMHKGYAYTNRELMECLERSKEHGVLCDLFFILGLPFEKEGDLHEMVRLQREVRHRYPNVRGIRTFTVQMEPGSPWHLDPEAFGVKTSLRNFMDFYHYHSEEGSPFSSPGYWIPDYFQGVEDESNFEKRLKKIQCRHFCFIHPDVRKSSSPFWGRRFCDLSNLLWKIKALSGRKEIDIF
ncbi:MAG: cobalamin B12-binding domain-containing protein [Syntrophaceae bacterium]|nr:cobalamin B12-binding domain-containing protein [Syntrophaceae bacterium]